jgi:hypothetical protein
MIGPIAMHAIGLSTPRRRKPNLISRGLTGTSSCRARSGGYGLNRNAGIANPDPRLTQRRQRWKTSSLLPEYAS